MNEFFKDSWKDILINFLIAFVLSFVIITTIKMTYPLVAENRFFSSIVFLGLFYLFTRLRRVSKIRDVLANLFFALIFFPLLVFLFVSLSPVFRNWYFVGLLGVVSVVVSPWVRKTYQKVWRAGTKGLFNDFPNPFKKRKKQVDENKH